ncbi:cobyric acid synthase [Halomicrococcus gelatinilyticus]|uniref:cobyric acid synthase n=1 Tax=Halomicrococcus gelatinilyticus TaxID=1702103 RepID=UPI002E141A75
MTHTLLVAGTASHVGKSTVATGLCRRLARQGVSVAPFKAQNMSNNARAVVTPDGDWGEVGVSQYVQVRAANVAPTTDANPVLLKPRGDGESQLVVQGEPVGHFAAGDYYEEHWHRAREAAVESYERLAADHDVVVAEGAGSIAEINLHDRDLANVETARFADASILLLGDIERGGVFASLYGTLELLPDDLRERVYGVAITKFRGDAALLEPGIEEFERRTDVPVVGVLPHDDPGLPEEDSLSLPSVDERALLGDDDGVSPDRAVTVGVPRLPHVSNFTDVDPLARVPGVRVAYLPLDATLDGVDALVLPGTKNTVDDLLALREAGFDDALATFSGPVVGICGGYQMLGERLTNAAVEGTGRKDTLRGFGLLPVETRFTREKEVRQVSVDVTGTGPIDGATGTASGYEIHVGRTSQTPSVGRPLGEQSAATSSVLGTYLHGLFENENVRAAFCDAVFRSTGTSRPFASSELPSPYVDAADLVDGIDLPFDPLP